jgi:hypothetical protein
MAGTRACIKQLAGGIGLSALDDPQGAAGEGRGDATGASSALTGSPVEVEGRDEMEACVEAEC